MTVSTGLVVECCQRLDFPDPGLQARRADGVKFAVVRTDLVVIQVAVTEDILVDLMMRTPQKIRRKDVRSGPDSRLLEHGFGSLCCMSCKEHRRYQDKSCRDHHVVNLGARGIEPK